MIWPAPTIRLKLTLWYTAALSLFLIAFSITIYITHLSTISSRIDDDLHNHADGIANLLKHEFPNGKNLNHEISALEEFSSGSLLKINSDSGELIQSENWNSEDLDLAFVKPSETEFDTRKNYWTLKNSKGRIYRLYQRNIKYASQDYKLSCATEITSTVLHHQVLGIILLTAIPFLLAVSAGGGYFLAGKLLSPIREITGKTKNISENNLHEQLPLKNKHDEFGQLSMVMNDLLSRLHRSFEQLRRFTSDASHELRTPLTAIRTVGETALKKDLSPERYREIIGSMLEEVNRQTSLIESLLTLTRADAQQIPLHLEVVDICQEVESVAELLSVLAEEKMQHLELDLPGKFMVRVDRSSIRQALINILDNAIKFSPVKTCVNIRVYFEKDVVVDISDEGPGISDTDISRIFDRFYRVDKSRSSTGSGLGLSIAKQAVENCGGRITVGKKEAENSSVHKSVSGGTSFKILLPKA